MPRSLTSHILHEIQSYTARRPGAWIVWCDPRGDWAPLLHVALAGSDIPLIEMTTRVAGYLGGPVDRARVQAQITTGTPFVLRVAAGSDDLGWLWVHALRAEQIISHSLRTQLQEWGWRPQVLHISDEELRVLAEQNLDRDPAHWGSGGLEPNLDLVLSALLLGVEAEGTQRVVLNLSADRTGLGQPDPQHPESWRAQAIARLLVTDAHHHAPACIPENHTLLIAPPARVLALQLIDRWRDSRTYSDLLPRAVELADPLAALDTLLHDADPATGPLLSRRAEQAVYAATCRRLAAQEGRNLLDLLAQLGSAITAHSGPHAIWADPERAQTATIPWRDLARLSLACHDLRDASPQGVWASPQAALDWYVDGGWRVDRAGEEILRTLEAKDPALIALLTPLRAAYRARWEQQLMAWSEVWNAAGCPDLPYPTAGERLITFLDARRPTAIIAIDALRYDLGHDVAHRINTQESAARATVHPARAPLPSITALGMGMTLPIPAPDLVATCIDGRWSLRERGQDADLSLAAMRRAWWTRHGHVAADALLTVSDVLNHEVPRPAKDRPRLVVTDHTLDDHGHDGELEVAGTAGTLRRYVQLIQRLRDAGWLRIAIVTDHGYIHWTSQHDQRVPPPDGETVYRARRTCAYRAGVPVVGAPVTAPGGQHPVAVPSGAACFIAYGGRGYYHGGASLQEWVIPMIAIDWPARAKPVDVSLRPQPSVLSQRPRVTLDVPPVMFPEEQLARDVKLVIVHAGTRELLFASDPQPVSPTERPDMTIEIVASVRLGASATRGTALLIEVRDARTDAVLASTPSTLMIELRQTNDNAGW